MSASTVLVVIVCYHPQVAEVSLLARSLLSTPNVDVCLIDNTDDRESAELLHQAVTDLPVTLVSLGENRGLAAAQNLGIREARARGCEAVWLLDQDSHGGPQLLYALWQAYERLQRAEDKIAAVGPTVVDRLDGHRYAFVKLQGLRMRPRFAQPGQIVECDFVISSGSLVPMRAFDAVGEFDESMFIDYVDIDWCLRARALGWKTFGIGDVSMSHAIGERAVILLGRRIPVHAPYRLYYLVRNLMWLARKPYVPWQWRYRLAYRALVQVIVFGLFCAPRRERAKWMLKGFVDGLRRRRSEPAAGC